MNATEINHHDYLEYCRKIVHAGVSVFNKPSQHVISELFSSVGSINELLDVWSNDILGEILAFIDRSHAKDQPRC